MGLMEQLTQQVLGEVGGGPHHEGAVQAAMDLLQQHGGIAGLAQVFQQKGLGSMMSSWISTGPNPAITGDQLSGVLGSGQLGALAQKFGIPPQAAAGALAAILPTLIDKLTPQGQIPQQEAGGNLLGGLLKNLGMG
ncbi:MAG: YidB family protein [Acidobacteriota bacterium]